MSDAGASTPVRPFTPLDPGAPPEERDDRERRRSITMIVLLLLGVLVGSWFLFMRDSGKDDSMAGAPFVTNFVASWRESDQATIYTVDAVDPQEEPLSYRWRADVGGCGAFTAQGQVATWAHPTGAGDSCLRSTATADGGIAGTVSVVISDGTFDCTVTYTQGSVMDTMANPATCVRLHT